MKKYLLEGIVIFSSVLLSLYLGNLNNLASEEMISGGIKLNI
jgi:hypothetical protein